MLKLQAIHGAAIAVAGNIVSGSVVWSCLGLAMFSTLFRLVRQVVEHKTSQQAHVRLVCTITSHSHIAACAGFAAQSLLAALGSIQFVSNVFFAWFVLHERVSAGWAVCTLLPDIVLRLQK